MDGKSSQRQPAPSRSSGGGWCEGARASELLEGMDSIPVCKGVPTAAGRYWRSRSTQWPGTARLTSAALVVRGRSVSPHPGTQMYMAPLASVRGQRPTQAPRLNARQTRIDLHNSLTHMKRKRSTNPRCGEPLVTDSQSGDRPQCAAQSQHLVKGVCVLGKAHGPGPASTACDWVPRQQPDAFDSAHMKRSSQLPLLALRKGSSNSSRSGSASTESGYADRGHNGGGVRLSCAPVPPRCAPSCRAAGDGRPNPPLS